MQVSVVRCNCGNPEPHCKLRTELGRESSPFFSIAMGKEFHKVGLEQKVIEQTEEEKAATEQEITDCGLPEEEPPIVEETASSESKPEKLEKKRKKFLEILAQELGKYPKEKHFVLVGISIMLDALTSKEGERVLAIVAKAKQSADS